MTNNPLLSDAVVEAASRAVYAQVIDEMDDQPTWDELIQTNDATADRARAITTTTIQAALKALTDAGFVVVPVANIYKLRGYHRPVGSGELHGVSPSYVDYRPHNAEADLNGKFTAEMLGAIAHHMIAATQTGEVE